MYYMLLIKVYGEKHLLRTLLVSNLINFLGKTICKTNRGKWMICNQQCVIVSFFFFLHRYCLYRYLDNGNYLLSEHHLSVIEYLNYFAASKHNYRQYALYAASKYIYIYIYIFIL